MAMSNYLNPVLKFSGAILGLYCTVLSIAPIAHAGETTNRSNPPVDAFSIAKDESEIEGGKGSYNKSGDSSGTDPNRLAKIRAQQMQFQLEEEQYAYKSASERVKQVEAQTPPSTSQPGAIACSNISKDSKACVSSSINKRSKLASARAAKATAAANLAKTQVQMRQFLASIKAKNNMLSSKTSRY
jgi:uncharacterized protein involved in exopolysaccharide biosynthesis